MTDTVDPIRFFLDERERARAAGEPWDACAVALATIGLDGHPTVRYVLVKEVDANGFRFYTNRESRKGVELGLRPHASFAVLFAKTDVQFRVSGDVTPLSDAENDRYFRSRPVESQLGAWASAQSRPIESREALVASFESAKARYGDDVPRPPHWGGYILRPTRIEHWVNGAHRLHDRLEYLRTDGGWQIRRLAP